MAIAGGGAGRWEGLWSAQDGSVCGKGVDGNSERGEECMYLAEGFFCCCVVRGSVDGGWGGVRRESDQMTLDEVGLQIIVPGLSVG